MRKTEVKPPNLILNVGCGKQTYGNVRADLSHGNANILLDVGNQLPFRDEVFDEVYSRFLFEHLRNPSFVLGEMVRVLKIRGKLVIITDNAAYVPFHLNPKLGSGFHVKNGYFGPSLVDKHYALYTIEHLKNHILFYKLKIIEIKYAYSQEVTGKSGGPFQKISKMLCLSKIFPFLKPLLHPNLMVVALKLKC